MEKTIKTETDDFEIEMKVSGDGKDIEEFEQEIKS